MPRRCSSARSRLMTALHVANTLELPPGENDGRGEIEPAALSARAGPTSTPP
jgi:hypothetical protein